MKVRLLVMLPDLSFIRYLCSFVTESTSIALNAGLDIMSNNELPSQQAEAVEENDCFGIPNSTLSLQRHSAFLKGLKYGDGSYTAFLSPIDWGLTI